MKRLYAHMSATAVAAALLLLSCSYGEDTALPTGADAATQPLNVSTRAGDDESFDSFRLYLSDAATNTQTEVHLLTWDGTAGAWLEDGEQPVTALLPAIVNASVCDSPDQITFENHLEGEEITTVTCQIPTDQTDADKLAAAGKRMFAISKLDRGETLSLTFQLACSKLVFLVDNSAVTNAGGEGKLTNIHVGVHPEYVYHYEGEGTNNYYTWNEGDKCDVTCYLAEADAEHENKPSITACLGYRRCAAGDVLMTLSVDGISRNVPIKNALEIIPGNVYTFQLEITPKEVTASVVAGEGNNDIPGWEESNEEEL